MKKTKLMFIVTLILGLGMSIGISIVDQKFTWWPALAFVLFPQLVILVVSLVRKESQW